MRTTRRASLILFCFGILLLIGACSAGGGSPVTPDNGPDLSNYASTVEGYIHQGGGPVTSGEIYIYNLDTLELLNKTDVKSDGSYIAGVNEGQYLMFAFGPTGWQTPQLEADFSNYINVEADNAYRADISLTRYLNDGEELIFGFVTSSGNEKPVGGATITAGGKTTTSDGYGFYVMAVPTGTSDFTVTAPGFYNLNENIRDGQASSDFYKTPYFNLNPMTATGSSIGGVVRDIFDGTGLGGVRITLSLPADPNFLPRTYLTNLGGAYRFFNLTEGIYKLYFERPGYIAGARDGLVIKDQDDSIINVFMNHDEANNAKVWGYVNNAGIPLPVSGARVTATNPLLGNYMSVTNPTGYYQFPSVIPGNYTMTVATPGVGVTFYEATSTFQTIVSGDNRIDFALRFIDEGVLRGTVTTPTSGGGTYAFPPTGIEVTAEKIGGSLSGVKWRTTTNGQGIFVFNGIPMGIYKVEARVEYQTLEVYTGTMYNVMVNSGQTTSVDIQIAIN